MVCYRNNDCGPYKYLRCYACPASRPDYPKKMLAKKNLPTYKVEISDPVKFYKLTVKAEMKFRGKDARAARRWFYDSFRRHDSMCAGFDGPRDPIVMSFYCDSGLYIGEYIRLWLPRLLFEDLEISLQYQCSDDPKHCGKVKYGKRKRGLAKLFSFTKENELGQMKLY